MPAASKPSTLDSPAGTPRMRILVSTGLTDTALTSTTRSRARGTGSGSSKSISESPSAIGRLLRNPTAFMKGAPGNWRGREDKRGARAVLDFIPEKETAMKLSAEQKAAYERDGFLLFPELVTPAE